MKKRRPFGITILAILVGLGALVAIYHTLQFLRVLPFSFGSSKLLRIRPARGNSVGFECSHPVLGSLQPVDPAHGGKVVRARHRYIESHPGIYLHPWRIFIYSHGPSYLY